MKRLFAFCGTQFELTIKILNRNY